MELEGPADGWVESTSGRSFEDRYRVLASELASGVAIVSARHRGRDHAVTVTGWLDVSWDPPTMAVSLFDEARICEAVEGSGTWVLSVLARDQEGVATWLASPGNPVEGLLNTVAFRRAESSGAPVIDRCLAWFEVRTEQVHSAATHRIVIGRVVAMGRGRAPGDARQAEQDPLVHWSRSFHGLR
ncbi:flavin reductase [Kocuria sp. JC486]|uniref:flavin reductase family protein n=1 Tax=Kocuria sp. JC486 TaxID=1970736 RepID=UPI0014223DA1|nr:flavin reductase family protein [Kocuria sp. JC486]NHU86053.1 flavin reductase [Kocuria sp. JC486]